MKFTPIVDKHVVLHDVTKKMHVSFDEPMDIIETKEKKKRSHPAHDDQDNSKVKKSKSSKKEKEDKKDKKNKKDKKEKKEKKDKKEEKSVDTKPIVTETPIVVEKKPVVVEKKPVVVEKKVAVLEKKSLVEKKPATTSEKKPAAVAISVGEPVKVRGPKFTPKKVKAKPYQAPKKLTEEEVKAKVAAIRKKKLLRKQSKVKVNGEVIVKPIFNIKTEGLSDKVIPTKQLGEFVLYALSETTNLPWCNIINKAKIEKLVFVYAQGLNANYFGTSLESVKPYVNLEELKSEEWVGKASMPFLAKHSKYMIVNEISGRNGRFNAPVADILQCNMSNSKKERLAKEQQERTQLFKNKMREYYILSLEDLKKADYPIPPFLDNSVVLPEGWKETHAPLKERKEGEQMRIIGIDCEMVLTVSGSTLARVTLIDEDGTKLLDEMVKPDEPIIDYLTKYSGITPEAMSNAQCSLRRAQKHVRKIVDHNTILVGHGLENDLKALRLAHPYCVDTSLLYDHHRGPPYKPSLRFLARNYLKRHIQDRNEAHIGHDSAEDAVATLDLFKLKLANKPNFGKFKRTELIMDRLLANRPPRESAIIESSKNTYRSFGSSHGGDYFRVDTDEELVEMTMEKIKEKDFLFTRYQTADEERLRALENDGEESAPSIVPSAAAQDSERAIRLQTMDSYIKTVYNGLPENSFIVVSGGVNNVPEYKKLYDKHQRYQEKYGSKKLGSVEIPKNEQWTEQNQKDLCKYAAEARMSSSFFIFKQ
ncbi:hypothetical protein BD770DRAFT_411681 [Pilaira anomala]|nr:hypothetical protein BD770DRAFT_411681 [Pilaira anomala]